jgi:hypothetical protein
MGELSKISAECDRTFRCYVPVPVVLASYHFQPGRLRILSSIVNQKLVPLSDIDIALAFTQA